MLRYAGVDAGELRKLNGNMGAPWVIYGDLLRREYGLPDEIAYWTIVYASDGTMPEDDAVANVRNALSGGPLNGIMEVYAGMIAAGRAWRRKVAREREEKDAARAGTRTGEGAALNTAVSAPEPHRRAIRSSLAIARLSPGDSHAAW